MLFSLRPPRHSPILLPLRHFSCKCTAPDISFYRESFARKMALAGIKPHHRIALGVSGGPDSMALCVLTAGWKSEGLSGKGGSSGYIDGLLGIVVDHRLRDESAEEARIVQGRVMKMGIRCEISCCNWPEGRPKIGDLQEAAREMRYQKFQAICVEQQIGVLLVGHHADDQICQGGKQIWVEDPTNQSTLFARNRIRNALKNLPSSSFTFEMKALVSSCRLTRRFIENNSHKMLEHSVSIMNEGYGIIDLEKLDPSKVEDLPLSKFLVMILQFISQRQRPIRGSAMRLLLQFVRNIPCKTSLTVAGCYLCAAPRSKGKKVIVCCSPESPFPSKLLLSNFYREEDTSLYCVIEQIIRSAKFNSDKFVTETHNIPFLHAKSSEAMLREAMQLDIISQSTYNSIRSLQMEEYGNFCSQNGVKEAYDSGYGAKVSSPSNVQIYPGLSYHFMGRFLVTWNHNGSKDDISSKLNEFNKNPEANGRKFCQFCRISQENALTVRHMVDADWLYLAKLSAEGRNELETSNFELERYVALEHLCSSYMKSSIQTALQNLKKIPAAARRALPVFVNSHNLPLCVPSIDFSCCPCLSIGVEFRPGVPLGGGYRSYL